MRALVLIATVAFVPYAPVISDRVDLVEVNHCYNKQGDFQFDQVIYWQWCDETDEYHVAAWRWLKSTDQVPQPDWKRGGYVALWHDGDLLRQVRTEKVWETWTCYDPELHDRLAVPQHRRRGLSDEHKPNERDE